jgi:tetratricopeptide (TPR) repeat protein
MHSRLIKTFFRRLIKGVDRIRANLSCRTMFHADKLLQSAIAHHQGGRLAEAETAYCALLKGAPTHIDGLRLLGGLYLKKSQWADAADYLEKAARVRPKDPEILTNLGIALHKAGRREEALARYRQALEAQPDYVSALNHLGSLLHEMGRLNDAIEVYGRVLRANPDSAAAHYHYANSLYAAGRGNEAIVRYEHALKLKPDYLEAMINLGMTLGRIGKDEQSLQWLGIAQSWFEKALEADPQNVTAMNNIGNVLRQQGKPEQALGYYREALRINPSYAQAWINMATSLRDVNLVDEAIEACRHALRLTPDAVDARINMGSFFQDMGRHAEAIALYDEVLTIKPESPDAAWNKSLSLLALGRYDEGWPLHETGLGIAHMRGEYPSPQRRWNGEDFAGKRLLIWAEQGLGDSLQFIRYAASCKQRGGTIIIMCPHPLRALFRNCPFIDEVPDVVEEKDFDMHAPMMSLPFIFKTTVDTIPAPMPYLFIGDAVRERWAGKVSGTGLKVGLVWAGNPRENQLNAHMIDRRRSMNLRMLLPLFDISGVQFYNLQMGANAAQIHACGVSDHIIDMMVDVKDFEDTGAIIEQLDLVLSVDTSVVHLAGGLGKPVWVMSRFDACWRWLQNRPDNPWYPTARVFGQSAAGDWAGVVTRIGEALAKACS